MLNKNRIHTYIKRLQRGRMCYLLTIDRKEAFKNSQLFIISGYIPNPQILDSFFLLGTSPVTAKKTFLGPRSDLYDMRNEANDGIGS